MILNCGIEVLSRGVLARRCSLVHILIVQGELLLTRAGDDHVVRSSGSTKRGNNITESG